MLPIEEGCLAATFGCSMPENNGKEVTVGKRIDRMSSNHYSGIPWKAGVRWEIDRELPVNNGGYCNHVLEINLLRIDGGEFEEEQAEEYSLTDSCGFNVDFPELKKVKGDD